MFLDTLLIPLAQTTEITAAADGPSSGSFADTLVGILFFLFVIAALVIPYLVGAAWAKKMRMADYGWRLGVILTSLVFGALVVSVGVYNDVNDTSIKRDIAKRVHRWYSDTIWQDLTEKTVQEVFSKERKDSDGQPYKLVNSTLTGNDEGGVTVNLVFNQPKLTSADVESVIESDLAPRLADKVEKEVGERREIVAKIVERDDSSSDETKFQVQLDYTPDKDGNRDLDVARYVDAGEPNQGLRVRWGVDLRGGANIIFKARTVAEALGDTSSTDTELSSRHLNGLVTILSARLNPSGTREITIRPAGLDQIEIIVPEVKESEINKIIEQVTTAGYLEFRIVANPRDDGPLIEYAKDEAQRKNRFVYDEIDETGKPPKDAKPVGKWAVLARETELTKNQITVTVPDRGEVKRRILPLKYIPRAGNVVRDPRTFEIIDLEKLGSFDDVDPRNREYKFEKWLMENGFYDPEKGYRDVEILMRNDDGSDVKGEDLRVVKSDYDNEGRPRIAFSMRASAVAKMRRLTSENSPTGDFKRQLGILLDNQLISAPNINSTIGADGVIEGQFTQAEVDNLVGILRAGALPAILDKKPLSNERIDSQLGSEMRESGVWSIAISLSLVLVFIIGYYRFAGVVACAALLTNLMLIVAVIILVKQPFTLPGLAGMVLTVGMSVDANVLIFERIREELNRGAALRMAIRNGFEKATTTIVDANLTTLITAIVLYVVGTDQIRGFAVTLILGILMSMYTAIFCSRVVFDLAEKRRKLKALNMASLVGATKIDFMSKKLLAIVCSCVLISVGLAAAFARGGKMFDIDLAGGTSVDVVFDQPHLDGSDIRKVLEVELKEKRGVDYSFARIDSQSNDVQTAFKIDTSYKGDDTWEEFVRQTVDEVFAQKRTDSDGSEYALKSFKLTDNPQGGASVDLVFDKSKLVLADVNKVVQGELKTSLADKVEKEVGQRRAVQAKLTPAENASEDETVFQLDLSYEPGSDGKRQLDVTGKEQVVTALREIFEQPREASNGSEYRLAMMTLDDGDGLREVTPDENTQSSTKNGKQDSAPERETKASTPEAQKDRSTSQRWWTPEPITPNRAHQQYFVAHWAQEKNDAGNPVSPPEPPSPEAKKEDSGQKPPADDAPDTANDGPAADKADGDKAPDQSAKPAKTFETTITLGHAKDVDGLRLDIESLLEGKLQDVVHIRADDIELIPVDVENAEDKDKKWTLRITGPEAEAKLFIEGLKSEYNQQPYFLGVREVRSQVAGDRSKMAAWALIGSLIGIIAYIWVRFQRIVFGLAAVVALVHDVLFTLGAIAVSAYVADYLGFLKIEEFKISLPVVAAFLTIIGYSLNDTIVVFDRIREVRGKSPDLTTSMVNASINQTLGRTLLTSLTTLIVVAILYFFGGQAIHPFAFALVVGVTVGTYSSIFVASPALLWMINYSKGKESRQAEVSPPARLTKPKKPKKDESVTA